MTDYLFFYLHVDSSLYANYVFNVFDNDRDGKVSFEVNVSLRLTYPNDQHLHTVSMLIVIIIKNTHWKTLEKRKFVYSVYNISDSTKGMVFPDKIVNAL